MDSVAAAPAARAGRVDLERLLRPKSIAVFGGAYAEAVIAQCARMGYAGDLWPVNPSRASIGGRPCVADVARLPGVPDAAFLGVNRRASVALVRELSRIGAGGAVAFASGFGESDGEGEALQRALKDAAGGMPVLGPNCYGLINYLDGAPLWPDLHGGTRVGRGVALLMQSSNMAITASMARRALPLGYLVTLGNQACVGLPDVIDAVLEDDRVTAIGLHIEGIDNAVRFAGAAQRAAAKGVPMVALKVGRSARSSGLTRSHTASLAGAGEVFDVLLRRLRIGRVDSLPMLIEALKLLHAGGPLRGNRLVSLSCSGGEAALVADSAAGREVDLAEFSAEERARIGDTVSPLVSVSNPFDYHTYDWFRPDRLYATHCAVMAGSQDLTALLIDFPKQELGGSEPWAQAVEAFARAADATGRRAVVVSTLPECMPEARAAALLARGVAPLLGIDDALGAIAAAAQAAPDGKSGPMLTATAPGPDECVGLTEWHAKQRLGEFGIPLPRGFVCETEAEAIAAARAIGAPVAMKALHPDFAHKTEAGAVHLDVKGERRIEETFAVLAALGAPVLVEEMVGDALIELIVGAVRDPVVGLHLFVGAGGVTTELTRDGAVLLLPVDRGDVADAIRSLRIGPLFAGYRGGPVADLEAVIDIVLAVQRFVMAHLDSLSELEINPLMVRPRGAVATDALIRLCPGA